MEEQGKRIRLTSGEIAQLWTQYMFDTSSICILSYLLDKSEEEEIKPIIEFALNLSKSHIQKLTSIFAEEKYVTPHGFKVEEDVDISAPRLFSDTHVLNFLFQMARAGLTTYALAVSLSVRADITEHYTGCLSETMQLYKMTKDTLLSKGLFIRSPSLPIMSEVEFINKQSFIWDLFKNKRPLNALEIANLYADFLRNALGAATLTGFVQVAKSKEVKKFLVRGIEIAKKHLDIFGDKLKESNLPVPSTLNSEITESVAHTFSDKLLMFNTTFLTSLSTTYYGIGIATCPRVDLGLMYTRLSAEVQLFAEDGANIMIENRWFEQPPMALDRDELAKQ